MKKMFCIICGVSVLLFSCREDEAEPCTDPAQQIWLRARVENAITMSRAPFDPPAPDEKNPDVTAPNKMNPLKVDVWASTTEYYFKHETGKNGKDGIVALHTNANFTAGSEQLLNEAVYPKTDNTPVYFVGLHPQGVWDNPTGDYNKATMTFNGSQDVMFAPQISGVYGGNLGEQKWPVFKFKHLLTWLTVTVKAESETVSEAWGRLKSIKVKCVSGNTVTIDLGKAYDPVYNPYPIPGEVDKNCVTFSSGEGVALDFYDGKDEVLGSNNRHITIPHDKFKEVAYVLCAPVIASASDGNDKTTEYTLIVETEQRTVEVPVDLMKEVSADSEKKEPVCFEGSTMNYHFTLNLNFKMGNNIMLTSSAGDWELGGISSGTISPE